MHPEPPTSGVTYRSFVSLVGHAGVIIDANGDTQPLPEHEALAAAIPQWVQHADQEADCLRTCLALTTHEHPTVRAAAFSAFGELARRSGRLGERTRVVPTLEIGLRDRNEEVRDAATRSAVLVEASLGWQIARPDV